MSGDLVIGDSNMNDVGIALFEKQIVPFCGAGISLASGIPLVAQIKQEIVRAVAMTESDIANLCNYNIPFEAFIQVLAEETDITQLFNIFRTGKPNTNHFFLAKLAKKGQVRTILTTDFDTFLEDALEVEGVAFEYLYRDDDLQIIRKDDSKVKVIKLHGHIHDTANLAITIRRVASQRLIPSRMKVLQDVFGSENTGEVWFFGYSLSDRFDINPILANVPLKKAYITYVAHEDSTDDKMEIRSLSSEQYKVFSGYAGQAIHCHTDDLVEHLWKNCLSEDYMPVEYQHTNWPAYISAWQEDAIQKKSAGILPCLCAALFREVANYSTSNVYLWRAISSCDLSQNPELEILCYQLIGDNSRDLGFFDASKEFLRRSLQLSEKYGFERRTCRALTSIGTAFEDQKNHNEAIDFQRKALEIARTLDDRDLLSRCCGNLAIALKNRKEGNDLEEALELQRSALAIAEDIGDIRSIGRTHGNIGIIHSDLGDIPSAIDHYQRALSIAKDLGDELHIAIWNANLGIDVCSNDTERAKLHLQEAIRIFSFCGRRHDVEYCANYLKKLDSTGGNT